MDEMFSSVPCLRSAMSRAYYSAFIGARNFLRERREIGLRGSAEDHRLVRDRFMQSTDRTRKQIGVWLGRLSATRGKADYEDVFVGSLVKSAEASLQAARYLLDSLRRLP